MRLNRLAGTPKAAKTKNTNAKIKRMRSMNTPEVDKPTLSRDISSLFLVLWAIAWVLMMALCWTLEAGASQITMTASITVIDAVSTDDLPDWVVMEDGWVHL